MTDTTTCSTCDETQCSAQSKQPGEREQDFIDRQQLQARLCRIRHKVLVLSGKGGVGKSTVAANVAVALAQRGRRVGLLDIDIHGPSIPKLLGIAESVLLAGTDSLLPVSVPMTGRGSLSVMSIGFLLRERDDAVIWRGPRKFGAIKQFLKDVAWGSLDDLIVDSPPGTGDEPLAVAQLIPEADGALVVTTPQEISVQDVRRCVAFCRQVEIPVLGVIENMSGFTCPDCGRQVSIFGADGGRAMAAEMNVPFLGALPIAPDIVALADQGVPIVQGGPQSETARALGGIVDALLVDREAPERRQP